MKKSLRNLLGFLVGWLLVGLPMMVFAETIPATQQTSSTVHVACNTNTFDSSCRASSTSAGACNAWKSQFPAWSGYTFNNVASGQCWWNNATLGMTNYSLGGKYIYPAYQCGSATPTGSPSSCGYTCPSGQGWTLDGQTCTRPDCAAGQTRDANGVCVAQACPTGQFSAGWYAGSAPAYACASNGCGVSFTGSWPAGRDSNGNLYSQGSYSYTGGNQGECTPGGGTVAVPETTGATTTPTTPGPSGCASGDGVITSSTGKVACVPAGTPGSTPPKNNTQSKTETFSDGSTKTTNTTQVCTGDGACQTITTTTVTAAGGGGAGQAGTPGTTTAQTDKPPADTSGFCAQNPSLQICKGDMNKETTQREVLDEIKKLTDPTWTDDSAITSATHNSQSQTDLEAEQDKFTSAATGSVDPVSGSKSSWAAAMESGWWTPVPERTCSAWSGNFVGRTVSLDYCDVAEKVSSIGAYALWFYLCVGVFVMLTGGARKEGA